MHAIAAFALTIFLATPIQKPSEPAKKPTELDLLVKTKSIDKLRAKFLQAPNDDVRDEVRAAIMTVVSEVHAGASKKYLEEAKRILAWPDHEHRGYVNLNAGQNQSFKTSYGKHLGAKLECTNEVPPWERTWCQLIIVAGELDGYLQLNDCVVLCDSIKAHSLANESVVIAASDININGNSSLIVSNGKVAISVGTNPSLYSAGEIFLLQYKQSVKEYAAVKKVKNEYYAEGKIADTGLTFFKLADLGIVCKLDADKAVVVESVKAGSPAEVGQLKAGDVLSLVNLRRVKALDKVEELFRYAMMDSPKAKVTVTRGKESLDLEILFP